MTTQEIKDLIASKIAGQGSMVDIGGALPNILDEIIDAVGKTAPLRIAIASSGGVPAPTASQKAQIKAAMDSGQNVELIYEDEYVSPIVRYSVDSNGVYEVEVATLSGLKDISLV